MSSVHDFTYTLLISTSGASRSISSRQQSLSTSHLQTDQPVTPFSAGRPSDAYARTMSPPINILPSVLHDAPAVTPIANGDHSASTSPKSKGVSDPVEAPDIAALLMAQRARTPLAIAVAQDYSSCPFKIPRPFVVLGWFWLADAWVSEPSPAGCKTDGSRSNQT